MMGISTSCSLSKATSGSAGEGKVSLAIDGTAIPNADLLPSLEPRLDLLSKQYHCRAPDGGMPLSETLNLKERGEKEQIFHLVLAFAEDFLEWQIFFHPAFHPVRKQWLPVYLISFS